MDSDTSATLIGMLVVVALVALIGWAVYYAVRTGKKWVAWAGQVGWRSVGKWAEGANAFYGGPFNVGRWRRVDLLAQGTFDGAPAQSFRYRYTVNRGRNWVTYNNFIFRLIVPGAQFPHFELRDGQGLVSKVFNRNDGNARQWDVQSPSPQFAHEVMTQQLMGYLNRPDLPKFESLWLEGDSILVNRKNSLKPEEAGSYLRLLSDIARMLPDVTYRNLGVQRPSLNDSGFGPAAGMGAAPSAPHS